MSVCTFDFLSPPPLCRLSEEEERKKLCTLHTRGALCVFVSLLSQRQMEGSDYVCTQKAKVFNGRGKKASLVGHFPLLLLLGDNYTVASPTKCKYAPKLSAERENEIAALSHK